MATVSEIYQFLDEKLPRSLSCSWDNDGLMVTGDSAKKVKTVLFALDITDAVITEAIDKKADLILSHHPLLFKGLRHVNGEDFISKKVIKLIQNGISAMSFHTRLDASEGGVNDILANTLELENVEPWEAMEDLTSRIGTLKEEMTFESFCDYVKTKLGAPSVMASKGKPTVKKVAVLGGSGRDGIFSAMANGADAYVTGECGYHNLLDAMESGFSVIVAGHDFTERLFYKYFEKTLGEQFPALVFLHSDITCSLYHA